MLKERALRRNELIDESNSNFRVARSAYTDQDIYEIEIIGTYCENTDLSDILARDTECENRKISRLFMTQNIDSEDWGFAADGFQTTNGKYLKVIKP